MNGEFTVFKLLMAMFWAFGASLFCAVVFNAAKKEFILGGVLGAFGWGIYVLFSARFGQDTLGYLLGAFAVAAGSEILAPLVKNPATVYLLPGLLPLVPGGGMFQTMRAVVTGNMDEASDIGYKTLMAAGAIALGIAIASSFARLISLGIRQWRVNLKLKKQGRILPR